MSHSSQREDRGRRRLIVWPVIIAIVAIVVASIFMRLLTTSLLWLLTTPQTVMDAQTYDYAGPDGTLTGVPWELKNYVVEDHDTGCYYFLIINEETHDMALCPRFEADGTLWTNPLHEEASE